MHLKVVAILVFVAYSTQNGYEFIFQKTLNARLFRLKSILHDDEEQNDDNFRLLLEEIMVKNLLPYKCVVLLSDDIYSGTFSKSWFRRFGPYITFIVLNVEEYEDLLSPFDETKSALTTAKNEGCQMYIILVSNGLQVARLLRFGDRYRVINTRAKFIISYDNRLFDKSLFYIWKRIINVIFIRRYGGERSGQSIPWFEITTVPFPSQITSVLVPRRLDIWTKSKFRKGVDLFRDKTSDLRNQTLKVAAFSHIPGTTKNLQTNTVRAVLGNFSGAEVEVI